MTLTISDRRYNRRKLMQQLVSAPLIFRAAPLAAWARSGTVGTEAVPVEPLAFHDDHVSTHYPSRSPLEDVLRLVQPGSDEYVTELYASEIDAVLRRWSAWLSAGDFVALRPSLAASLQATPLANNRETKVRTGDAVEVVRRNFSKELESGADAFIHNLRTWIGSDVKVEHADFEITSIHGTRETPLTLHLSVRYDVVTSTPTTHRRQHLGSWTTEWQRNASQDAPHAWQMHLLQATSESVSSALTPIFVDVSDTAFERAPSYRTQLLRGADHWRSVIDVACGIDIYGNNGVAAGDFDNDGHDDLYVSQPAGLPNRLYRNRGDGTFEDVTDKAGVGVLDNTSCALFADLRNVGLQDLLVVCGNGPLLFINQGDGTFQLKRDAFAFAQTPQGTFTHAAIADYDLDGRLDVFFCVYSYYLGLDQYHYPIPYFDARNGPPNFLFHNQGNATFIDRTDAAGLGIDNDRYSFACAWGQASAGSHPDLYVVNDFGRNVLYRSNGNGTFTATSGKANVEDVGAGMSACWADTTNSGRSDLYVANMWSAAGQRVAEQPGFHAGSTPATRELYRQHANGNALYRNVGDGTFKRAPVSTGVDDGRWAWCSDFWDFDHDGYPDLYVTNGYITAPQHQDHEASLQGTHQADLGSFFWRQVVGKSPDDSTPSLSYEHGWNALNELVRSDTSWSGSERNVLLANKRDGTFSDISGVAGLDLLEDGRSFALADFDGDGRLEVAVKNRNAPQLRLFRNQMTIIGDSLAVRLRGTQSNRDAIGTSVTITVGDLVQKKFLQAGSGFLAQHTKEVFFGLGKTFGEVHAVVHWPSGVVQEFKGLPRNNRVSFTEGESTFVAQPFSRRSTTSPRTLPAAAAVQQAPLGAIETWLIDPLRAPAFSLPDLAGRSISLASYLGGFTLLQFWSVNSSPKTNVLSALQVGVKALLAGGLKILALNVDNAPADQARAFIAKQKLGFSTLFTTEDVVGTYNIIYRYLFDRRRDLPVPCAFLLDRAGMIVKVYQGPVKVDTLLEDLKSIPTTTQERLRKGLPFAGTLLQSDLRRNDFTYGVAMFQHGYLEQAEASFQQVVLMHPENAEGHYNLGTLSLRKKNFEKARTHLHQSLLLKSDYPEAWNNLGMMAAQQGHTEEAVKNFRESIHLRPGYAVAWLNLGNAYRRKNENAKAQDALSKALALQPDDPEVNYSLGVFYAQQGEIKPAEDYLKRSITLRPDYPEALNNLGVLYVRNQDYEHATEAFQTCIAKRPTFEQSYLNLARLYVLQNERAKARTTLQTLLSVKPDSAAGQQALQSLEARP